MSLSIENVTKNFTSSDDKSTVCALDNVSLTINEGEFICIVGQSGCGKSTILRLIAGLTTPTHGVLKLDGKIIEGTDPNRGMVFQKPTLFPWMSVEDNLSFSLRMTNTLKGREKDVEYLLKIAGLSEFKDSYPHHLSGGMAQRLALIRTMINDPQVFLLDEPLGALDAFTRMNMQEELVNSWLQKKRIMLMVTHDIDEAIYMSTKVVVMAPRPGRIKAEVPIELNYPRDRKSPEFMQYRAQILGLLDLEHNKA